MLGITLFFVILYVIVCLIFGIFICNFSGGYGCGMVKRVLEIMDFFYDRKSSVFSLYFLEWFFNSGFLIWLIYRIVRGV